MGGGKEKSPVFRFSPKRVVAPWLFQLPFYYFFCQRKKYQILVYMKSNVWELLKENRLMAFLRKEVLLIVCCLSTESNGQFKYNVVTHIMNSSLGALGVSTPSKDYYSALQ